MDYQEHGALQVTLPLFFQRSPALCLSLNNLRGIAKEHLGTSRCLDCFDAPQLEQKLECGGPLAACSPEAGFCQLSVWLCDSCCTLQVLGIGLRCGRGLISGRFVPAQFGSLIFWQRIGMCLLNVIDILYLQFSFVCLC